VLPNSYIPGTSQQAITNFTDTTVTENKFSAPTTVLNAK
jgi:hypothetical protein